MAIISRATLEALLGGKTPPATTSGAGGAASTSTFNMPPSAAAMLIKAAESNLKKTGINFYYTLTPSNSGIKNEVTIYNFQAGAEVNVKVTDEMRAEFIQRVNKDACKVLEVLPGVSYRDTLSLIDNVNANYLPEDYIKDKEYLHSIHEEHTKQINLFCNRVIKADSDKRVSAAILIAPFLWAAIVRGEDRVILTENHNINLIYQEHKSYLNWYIKEALKLNTEPEQMYDIIKTNLNNDILSW
jgi:hypothetical protein